MAPRSYSSSGSARRVKIGAPSSISGFGVILQPYCSISYAVRRPATARKKARSEAPPDSSDLLPRSRHLLAVLGHEAEAAHPAARAGVEDPLPHDERGSRRRHGRRAPECVAQVVLMGRGVEDRLARDLGRHRADHGLELRTELRPTRRASRRRSRCAGHPTWACVQGSVAMPSRRPCTTSSGDTHEVRHDVVHAHSGVAGAGWRRWPAGAATTTSRTRARNSRISNRVGLQHIGSSPWLVVTSHSTTPQSTAAQYRAGQDHGCDRDGEVADPPADEHADRNGPAESHDPQSQ